MPENTQQETALTVRPSDELPVVVSKQSAKLTRAGAFNPTNLTEAIALSKLIANSDLAPKDYKGKAANVLIAMQMGAEVGLAPMQSLQNIAVINGRPSLWGDAALGVVQIHPAYEWHKEEIKGEGDARMGVFQIKRKGHEPYTATFSVAQAKKAGLWGKPGPWQTYPDRMLQLRARGFGLRDKFSDALRGLILAEEAMDIAPDTSEAKKQREAATLDIGAAITDLAVSTEPNRGHEDTNLGRAIRQAASPNSGKDAPTMCGSCGEIGGHKSDCKYAEQDKRTAQFTKVAFLLLEIREKKKTKEPNKGQPYLILDVAVPQESGEDLQTNYLVWHQTLFDYLRAGKGKTVLAEVSTSKDGEKIFVQLERILQIGEISFVNNTPAQQGELLPAAEQDDF